MGYANTSDDERSKSASDNDKSASDNDSGSGSGASKTAKKGKASHKRTTHSKQGPKFAAKKWDEGTGSPESKSAESSAHQCQLQCRWQCR